MNMQVISGILIIAAIVSAVFGAGLFSLWKKSPSSRPLSLMVLSISLWALFIGLFLSGLLETSGSFSVSAFYAAAGITPIFAIGFALSYSERNGYRNDAIAKTAIKIIACIVSCVSVVVFCFWPDLLVKSIATGNFTVDLAYPAYAIYVTYFILSSLAATVFFAVNMLRAKRAAVKLGLKRVLIAWVVGGTIGIVFNLLLPLIGNYGLIWIGPPPIIILLIPLSSILVTTVEHFSLKKTFIRGLLYFLFASLSMFAVFLVVQFVSGVLNFADRSDPERFIIITLALVFLLPVIFTFFVFMRKAVDKLDSDGYDESEIIRSISYILEKKHGAKELFSGIRHTLDKAFGVKQVDIIIFGQHTAKYISPCLEDVLFRLSSSKKANTVYREDVRNKIAYTALEAHDIEVITPIISTTDKKVLGVMVLSPRKRKYDRYYGETLERIASVISPFVQSAILYEEVTDLNQNMSGKIRKKTRELRENNKELLKLDEMKNDLLNFVSHNLRTPLTGIKGYANMMTEGKVSKKELIMYAGEIVKSANIMNQTVSSLLDASRIEGGSFALNKSLFSLTEAADEEIEAILWMAEEKGIEIVFTHDKEDIEIDGDISRIKQVIANLLDNAIFYSKKKINVSLKMVENRAVFVVKDDGIGVPKDEQNNLFTKMFRASNAKKHRPDGMGIGLYVSKAVIESHGGRMIFHSVEDKGSTFGFEI